MEALVEVMKKMQPVLSDEYVSSGYGRAILIGVIMAALVIFTAFATKESKGLGITTGILQIAGSLGAHLWIVNFSRMEMLKQITAPTQEQLDKLVAEFQAQNLPKVMLYILGTVLFVLAAVMLLVYALKLMKHRPKILSVFALVVAILRIVAFAPINTFNVISQATEASQKSWDVVSLIVSLLNVLLIAAVGVIALVKKTPAAPVAAPEEKSEAAPEETPAE